MNNLVTFEQQLALRELGFNKGYYAHYFVEDKEGHWKRGDLVTHHYDHVSDLTMFNPVPEVIPANTIYEAVDFLETMGYYIEIIIKNGDKGNLYNMFVVKMSDIRTRTKSFKYKSKIQALSAGIDECIRIIKDNSTT